MGAPAIFADDADLYAACADLLARSRERGFTLGCAESCTGGLLSGCLTAVPGSSDVVRGAVVSYAIAVKRTVLGVSDEVLDDPALGAVSSECAEQMAAGARRALGCDVAVSVTGIAGPGGAEPGKPVGTVWMGVCSSQGCRTSLFELSGGRADIRHQAVRAAVGLLLDAVMEMS